jgi:hypothetical protein
MIGRSIVSSSVTAEQAFVPTAMSLGVFLDCPVGLLVLTVKGDRYDAEVQSLKGQLEQSVSALTGVSPAPERLSEPDSRESEVLFPPTYQTRAACYLSRTFLSFLRYDQPISALSVVPLLFERVEAISGLFHRFRRIPW